MNNNEGGWKPPMEVNILPQNICVILVSLSLGIGTTTAQN